MSHRIDNTQKMTRVLFAALIVFALVIPACMSVACLDTAMSGSAMAPMRGMPLAECLDAAIANDGFAALEMRQAVTMLLLAVFFGMTLVTLRVGSPAALGRAVASRTVEPPPPLDPRGERFLI